MGTCLAVHYHLVPSITVMSAGLARGKGALHGKGVGLSQTK